MVLCEIKKAPIHGTRYGVQPSLATSPIFRQVVLPENGSNPSHPAQQVSSRVHEPFSSDAFAGL